MTDLTDNCRKRLDAGRRDRRLGYAALALTIVAIVIALCPLIACAVPAGAASADAQNYTSIAPVSIVLLLAGFALSRVAVARASRRKDLRRQKWLLYPPLVTVYVPLLAAVLFWPIVPAKAIVDGRLFAGSYTERLGICRYCGPGARMVDLAFISAAMTGLWWAILGIFCGVWTGVPRTLLRPFAEGFSRNWAIVMAAAGLFVAVLFTGAVLLSA
jgi:hypothetical protein